MIAPEQLQKVLDIVAPLLLDAFNKSQNPPMVDFIRIKGEKLTAFLRTCPGNVQLIETCIEPDETYVLSYAQLKQLANSDKIDFGAIN